MPKHFLNFLKTYFVNTGKGRRKFAELNCCHNQYAKKNCFVISGIEWMLAKTVLIEFPLIFVLLEIFETCHRENTWLSWVILSLYYAIVAVLISEILNAVIYVIYDFWKWTYSMDFPFVSSLKCIKIFSALMKREILHFQIWFT